MTIGDLIGKSSIDLEAARPHVVDSRHIEAIDILLTLNRMHGTMEELEGRLNRMIEEEKSELLEKQASKKETSI